MESNMPVMAVCDVCALVVMVIVGMVMNDSMTTTITNNKALWMSYVLCCWVDDDRTSTSTKLER